MEKYKKSYKKNTFKTSAPTWNEKLELPDRSYFVCDIQDYFEYIIKNHQTITDNPPVRIYVNKIENRITFRILKRYYPKLLTTETMILIEMFFIIEEAKNIILNFPEGTVTVL